jgi:hypothetical protein
LAFFLTGLQDKKNLTTDFTDIHGLKIKREKSKKEKREVGLCLGNNVAGFL